MTEYQGVTTFHSETGTEGGYWAFQDEKFMGLENASKVCTRCGRVWDPERDSEPPKVSFTYWVDREGQVSPQGHPYSSGYCGFDEPQDLPLDRNGDNDSWDARWQAERNAIALACYEEGHLGWRPMYPEGMWSYEGLHILKDGDHLTVYDKDDRLKVVWEGEVKLNQHGLFTEDAGGLWIHADQSGIDRMEWAALFMDEHPAKLVTHE